MDFQLHFESKVTLTDAPEAHIAHIIEVGHVAIGAFRIVAVVPASIISRLSYSNQIHPLLLISPLFPSTNPLILYNLAMPKSSPTHS